MHVTKMFDLTGKVAVITGAGNGLGFQFAEAMAEAGADVVCADIDMKSNEATAACVEALGRKALTISSGSSLASNAPQTVYQNLSFTPAPQR